MAGNKKYPGYRPSRPVKLRLRAAVILLLTFSMVLGMSGFAHANGKAHKHMTKFLEKLIKQAEKALKKSNKLGFSDLGSSFWALEAITRMRGFGIIAGYDDNVFMPNNPVKQAEALAMIVRAYGFEDEAEELASRLSGTYLSLDQDLKKQDRKRLQNYWHYGKLDDSDSPGWFYLDGSWYPYVPVPARWSLGHILIAVDERWVDLAELNPEKPASRAWVAKVLVKASGNGKFAEARMHAPLDFKDAPAIPDGYWGYIAQAVEMGLFKGYVDKTFQPNKPVTRAELATILDRLISQELPEEMPYHVTGTVRYVSSSSIEIEVASGKTYKYPISKDAMVFVGSEQASVKDIKIGDTVRILTNLSDVAVLITVVKSSTPAPVPTREILGTIDFKVTTGKGEVVLMVKTEEGSETLTLEPDCTITDGRYNYTVSRLTDGDYIYAKERNGKVYYIWILADEDSTHISGTIKAKKTTGATRMLTIETKSGQERVLTLHKDVAITYYGEPIAYKDLSVEDVATFVIRDNQVVRIQVTERFSETRYVSGTVTGILITTEEMNIDVVDSSKKLHNITLSSNVRVTYKGEVVPRTQIHGGDKVKVRLVNNTGVEVEILEKYQEMQETTGVISEIKTTSSTKARTITVKQDDCKQFVLKISPTAEISRGASEISPDRLAVGDKIKVKHDGEEAVKIEILASNQAIPFGDLYGKLENVTLHDYAAVLIVEHDGEKTLVIADSETKVSYNNKIRGWSDLRKGDVVRIALDGHTAVEIRIVSRQ